MSSVTIRAMVCIESPDAEVLTLAKHQLRYTNPAYVRKIRFGTFYGAQNVPKHCLGYIYDEEKGHLWVPRAWFYSTLTKAVEATTVDTVQIPCKFPEPLASPLPHQQTALEALLAQINTNDSLGQPTDTYVVLPPSEGKTILGMLALTCIGEKTLVVVPTKEIEETWIKDAKKVFGDITLGRIRGSTIDHEHPVTIGSIQTLMKMDPSLWSDKFGVVMFDELHRLGAEVFANTVKRCRAHIRIGLTATDFRRDGRFISVRWHLGDPVFKTEERTNSVPLVYCPVITSFGMTRDIDEFTFNDLLEDLESNRHRTNAIGTLVRYIANTYPGDILVVSPRIGHLASLATAISLPSVTITGSTKGRSQLFTDICNGKHRIVLATTSIMSEGASNPRWHHVINTMPFSDPKTAIQLSGRGIRKDKGKTEGLFWDLVDANPMTKSMYAQRWRSLKRFLKQTRLHTIDPSPPYAISVKKG